jgi:inositol oxygenase
MSITVNNSGRDLDATSDAIDEGQSIVCHLMSIALTSSFLSVNVIKGKTWDDKSEFDESKDKSQFRDYDSACDRVKAFYKEQHGLFLS